MASGSGKAEQLADPREPSFEEPASEDVLAAMAGSVWGDMMREAVDEEDG